MRKFCKEISLAFLNPQLAKEWDYDKNSLLKPEDVSVHSNKKVFWKCESKGHWWEDTVNHRSYGRNCPYCSGNRVCKDNCLASSNSNLIKEWDYEKNYPLTPEKVLAHSHKKVWWICDKGHKYDAAISNRNKSTNNKNKETSCPYCSGKKACKDNCLSTLNPHLVSEWDYGKNFLLSPERVTCGSNKKAWWICNKGHSYIMSVSARSSGHNCPYCSNLRICIDNCLATLNPILSNEWDYEKNGFLTPKDVSIHSGKNVWWVCKGGHSYRSTVDQRSSGVNCPYCSGNRVCKDNCLATLNPKVSSEWDYRKNYPLTPENVTCFSNKKVWWLCKRSHESFAVISSRNNDGSCPYCSGHKVCIDNCLATLNPKLASEWHPNKNGKLTSLLVTLYSGKLVWWKCKHCGYEWKTSVSNRSQGRGCYCCDSIRLKDGSIFDSLIEAHYYLELKSKNIKFSCHVNFGLGKCSSDFYIPSVNKYIEITSYDKSWKHWSTYHNNILKKKAHITNVLKAKFEFVQLKLTPKQIQYVRENSI